MIHQVNIRWWGMREIERKFPNAHIEYCGRDGNSLKNAGLGNVVGKGLDRGAAIEAFRRQLWHDIKERSGMYARFVELAHIHKSGKDIVLVCWCKPLPCHTDVIASALEWYCNHNNISSSLPAEKSADMKKILITGSRQAGQSMISYARKCVERAKEIGASIVVGDAPGIDAAVIKACDEMNVPVIVYGAYGKLRNKSKTGTNLSHSGNYSERDRVMVELCDTCMAIWNGSSRGTKATYEMAKRAGKTAHLKVF